uniref:Uncharacterized protein n=1 Tax=Globodera pallida TaxID=36090 RepID=A0A183C1V5_GLOPA
MQKLKRCSRKQRLSKSPIRRKSESKKAEKKRLKNSEDELYLPLTKKTVPPPPALYEYLSTSESDNEIDDEQPPTEAAKLAEEFSKKNLPTSERMKAILALFGAE